MPLTGTVVEDWSDQITMPGNPDSGRWTVLSEESATYLDIVNDAGTPRLYSLGTKDNAWFYTDSGKWATKKQKVTIKTNRLGAGNGACISLGLMCVNTSGTFFDGYVLYWTRNSSVAPANTTFRISKHVNQWWGIAYGTQLITNTTVAPPTTELSFEYENGILTGFSDGVQVITYTDDSFSDTGYPAVGSNDGNFSATSSDCYFDQMTFTDRFNLAGGDGDSALSPGSSFAWNRGLNHP